MNSTEIYQTPGNENNHYVRERKVKKKAMMMEKEEEEDRRREVAIASTPCLQPNFNSKGITRHQLSKFRELHKKRLELKSKTKFKTKCKDGTNKKSLGNHLSSQNSGTQGLKVDDKKPSLWNDGEGFDSTNEDSKDGASVHFTPKKQKLHWGLDTKERWERKSNM